jgi:hypothetical protein
MAKIECSLKGMELVSIESKEEQFQIEDAIGLNYPFFKNYLIFILSKNSLSARAI